jgi:O-antigen/teichoic acid export membrane protein
VTAPIITRILEPKELGLASMFLLSLNVLTLLTIFGSNQAFMRYYYDLFGAKKRSFLYKIGYIIIPIYIFISVILIIFRKLFSKIIFEDESFSSLIILLIIGLFLNILLIFAQLIIRLENKGNIFSLQIIGAKIINFSGVLLFYYFITKDYQALIYGEIISIFVSSILLLYFTKKIWFGKKTPLITISSTDILNYSIPIALSTIVFTIFQSFDKFALKEFSSFDELGIYVGGFKIIALLQVGLTAFSTYWVPLSLKKFKDNSENTVFFKKVFELMSLLIFISIILFILSKDLLIMILGPEYISAKFLLPFFSFLPGMHALVYISSVGINFSEKTKWHVLVTGISCILNIILNIILIPIFDAKGAALATALSYVFFFFIYTIVSNKFFKIKINFSSTSIQIFLVFSYATINTFFILECIINATIAIFIITIIIYLNRNCKLYIMEYFEKLKNQSN